MSASIAPLLLVLFSSGLSTEQRNKALNLALPTLLPGPPETKTLFAAITAEREVRQVAANEQKLVTEAVKAAGITSADALVEFPTLSAAFNKLPAAVKSGILNPAVVGPPSDREIVLSPTPEAGAASPAPARGRTPTQPVTRPTP